jgi:hypothetical protein
MTNLRFAETRWRRWLPLRPRPIRAKNDADLCSVLHRQLSQSGRGCGVVPTGVGSNAMHGRPFDFNPDTRGVLIALLAAC